MEAVWDEYGEQLAGSTSWSGCAQRGVHARHASITIEYKKLSGEIYDVAVGLRVVKKA